MTQARRFFERALELDPNNVNALLGTGQVDAWVGATLTDNRAERLASAEAILSRVLSTASELGARAFLDGGSARPDRPRRAGADRGRASPPRSTRIWPWRTTT